MPSTSALVEEEAEEEMEPMVLSLLLAAADESAFGRVEAAVGGSEKEEGWSRVVAWGCCKEKERKGDPVALPTWSAMKAGEGLLEPLPRNDIDEKAGVDDVDDTPSRTPSRTPAPGPAPPLWLVLLLISLTLRPLPALASVGEGVEEAEEAVVAAAAAEKTGDAGMLVAGRSELPAYDEDDVADAISDPGLGILIGGTGVKYSTRNITVS